MNNPNQSKLNQNHPETSVESRPMVLIKQDADLKIKNGFVGLLLLLFIGLASSLNNLRANTTVPETITYYLNITDFAQSFIQIQTVVPGGSSTIDASYLAGRAPIYDVNNVRVGTCSASFLNMKTNDGIFTDISNYLSADNGLIVTWFTPTTLINLELDSIIHSMVTECIVTVTTKIGFSPFYGQTFNLIVSSNGGKIYFQFTRIGTISSIVSSKTASAINLKYCF